MIKIYTGIKKASWMHTCPASKELRVKAALETIRSFDSLYADREYCKTFKRLDSKRRPKFGIQGRLLHMQVNSI